MDGASAKLSLNTLTYAKVADDLRAAIDTRRLSPGEALLPERELARRYAVSVGTLRRSIQLLVEEGLVKKFHGVGTFVREAPRPSGPVALLLPTLQLSYYARIAELMEKYGEGKPFIITNPDDLPVSERIADALKRGHFGTLLLMHEISAEEYEKCRGLFPAVDFFLFDTVIRGVSVNSVCGNDIEGGQIATAHLVEQGRRTVVYVGNARFTNGRQRGIGYELAMREAGLPPRAVDSDVHFNSAYAAMRRVLAEGLRPDGVFAVTDMAAMGVVSALREAGLDVPTDCSVVGYSNLTEGSQFAPALSSIDADLDGMARYALREVAYRAAHPETSISQIKFQPRLIVRESSRVRR